MRLKLFTLCVLIAYLMLDTLSPAISNIQSFWVFFRRKNSSNSWQAMIHEDLLLSRIDILENKLSCYQKNITNEKLQEQINELQDEKEVYQVSTANYVKLELNQ